MQVFVGNAEAPDRNKGNTYQVRAQSSPCAQLARCSRCWFACRSVVDSRGGRRPAASHLPRVRSFGFRGAPCAAVGTDSRCPCWCVRSDQKWPASGKFYIMIYGAHSPTQCPCLTRSLRVFRATRRQLTPLLGRRSFRRRVVPECAVFAGRCRQRHGHRAALRRSHPGPRRGCESHICPLTSFGLVSPMLIVAGRD